MEIPQIYLYFNFYMLLFIFMNIFMMSNVVKSSNNNVRDNTRVMVSDCHFDVLPVNYPDPEETVTEKQRQNTTIWKDYYN